MKPIFSLAAATLAALCGVSLWSADLPPTSGTGCAECAAPVAALAGSSAQRWKDTWGIELSSLRLSARGYMIDFRYRVLDPEKAAALSNRALKPYLIDQVTGVKLAVPNTPQVGPMRQTAVKVEPGRIYATLFSNRGQVVKAGSKVTVVIGDCRLENLAVE